MQIQFFLCMQEGNVFGLIGTNGAGKTTLLRMIAGIMKPNEGHIFIKLTNDSKEGKILEVEEGTGFAQGIFIQFGITADDEVTEFRNGGMGSTTK